MRANRQTARVATSSRTVCALACLAFGACLVFEGACGTRVDIGGEADGSFGITPLADDAEAYADAPSVEDAVLPPIEDVVVPSSDGNVCALLEPPATRATCTSCDRGDPDCRPNGCYGGWWCDLTKRKCIPPPDACG